MTAIVISKWTGVRSIIGAARCHRELHLEVKPLEGLNSMMEMLQFCDNPSHKKNPPLPAAEPEDHSVIRLSRINPGRRHIQYECSILRITRNARSRILDQEISG